MLMCKYAAGTQQHVQQISHTPRPHESGATSATAAAAAAAVAAAAAAAAAPLAGAA